VALESRSGGGGGSRRNNNKEEDMSNGSGVVVAGRKAPAVGQIDAWGLWVRPFDLANRWL
jgi:hypothetical protein